MKISTQTKVFGIVALLGVAAAYGKRKYEDYNEVINKLQFELDSVYNLRVKSLSLFFDISVLFTNPTNVDFSVNSLGLVTVKKIKIFRKGVYLGEANSNITQLAIPANKSILLKNITIETKYLSFLSELSNLATLANLSDYTLEIIVEALGQTYVIEQPMM